MNKHIETNAHVLIIKDDDGGEISIVHHGEYCTIKAVDSLGQAVELHENGAKLIVSYLTKHFKL